MASDELGRVVVDRATQMLGAANGALWTMRDDEAHLVRAAGYSDPMLAKFRRVHRDAATPLANALAKGEDVFVESRAEYARGWPALEANTRPLTGGIELAFACLPLMSDGVVRGALAFAFHEARTIDREERSLLRILAQHCAVALQRAELFARESRTRDHLMRLQRVTSALAATSSRLDVARTLVEHALATVGASGGAMWVMDERRRLGLLYSSAADDPREAAAVERTAPVADAVRSAEAVIIRNYAEYQKRYPALAGARKRDTFALVALPVIVRGEAVGACVLTFSDGRIVDDEERRFLASIAEQSAIALERARLVDDLVRERKLLATILEQQPAAVVVAAPDGRLLLTNRLARAQLGAAPVAVEDYAPLMRARTPEGVLIEPAQYPLTRALRGETVADEVMEVISASEQRTSLRVAAAPVLDSDKVIAAAATFVDVTKERSDEQTLRAQIDANNALHRIAAALSAELDLDRLLQRLTDEATALVRAQFGSYFYNVLNDHDESYMLWTLSGVPREAFSGFPMPRNTAIFGPTFRGEGVVRHDDVTKAPDYGKNPPHRGMPAGHLPVRSYLAAPVLSRSGEVLGGLFFGHAEASKFTKSDEMAIVTVAAQAAICIDNARLYRDEQTARKNAEEALHVRDNFLSVASHELKTPVTAVSLQLQLLSRDLATGVATAERSGPRVASLQRGMNRLTSLVDELLDVSRLSAGRLEVENEVIDLPDLLRDVTSRFELMAAQEECLVTLSVRPASAFGDRQRTDQVLTNLLSNAIKYGRGRPIEVACGEDGDDALVSVRDHGIGIAPESLTRIFERFERATDARSFSGFGLGLWITKNLLDAMGGRISVDSELGLGSTFTARLPRSRGVGP